MTDTEERLTKLQKLLDRVLSRGDGDESSDALPVDEANGEPAAPFDASPDAMVTVIDKPLQAAPVHEASAEEERAIPLESRSRLVAVPAADSGEVLTEEDLVPESESPEDAVPLVRRSRPAIALPHAEERASEEPVSEGRIQVGTSDVQIADDSMMNDLAAEIAAEEVHSSELEEEAPASSRRPIAAEAITAMPEEEYSSPRHTPPPESGKQVAAPPLSSEPDAPAARRSSAPSSYQGDVDIVRPDISPLADVASFTAPRSVPRPATFGELLDSALEL